jgi:hypothetical protein
VIALALSDDDLSKLAKLLRMLGSSFDGERAAAGQKIHDFVTTRDVDWDELLRPRRVQAVVVQAPSGPRTWVTAVEEVLHDHYGALYPSELEFLPSLLAKGMVPTEKQAAWLTKIFRRTGVAGWDPLP